MEYIADPRSRSARQAVALRRGGHALIAATITTIIGLIAYFCTPLVGIDPFHTSFGEMLKALALSLAVGYIIGFAYYAFLNLRWRRLVEAGQVARLQPEFLEYWNVAIDATSVGRQILTQLGYHPGLMLELHDFTNSLQRAADSDVAQSIMTNAYQSIDDAVTGLVTAHDQHQAQLDDGKRRGLL